MTNSVQTFIDYLLDVETTSEVTFNEELVKNDNLYDKSYLPRFEQVIDNKLNQWKDFEQKERSADSSGKKAKVEASNNESEEEWGEDSSSDSKLDEGMQCLEESQAVEQTEMYLDTAQQCQRLLQLLYHCQQRYSHFADLYFHTLDRCVKGSDGKVITVALEQIALHISENKNDDQQQKRLLQCLPADLSSSTISQSHPEILDRIHTLLSASKTQQDTTAIREPNDIAELYPYKARFIDVRQEFRDSTHYFIDGDSLLLSIAHHSNVDLKSYHGNTLHVIYIIERILLTLFNQSRRCNYTLLFFECHHQLYQAENSILTLLRACLIAHLSKNKDRCGMAKLARFSSWLDEDYFKFAQEEKPMFLFYHDMSSFDIDNDPLLSKEALERLLVTYRLFGNYHQYYIQCHLYLMNKLTLTNTVVECFQIHFQRKCSMKLLHDIFLLQFNIDLNKGDDDPELEKLCQEIGEGDVRVFLYLKTLAHLIEEKEEMRNEIKLFSSLFVLHMALLTRLSLLDRHLPSSFPSITFSPLFSRLIVQFQQQLARSLSSPSSSSSWSKVVDLFDGRLFAFTLDRIHRLSANIRFDSTTASIIEQSFKILKIPSSENFFCDVVQQAIESKDILFSAEQPSTAMETNQTQQTVTKISNRFINAYLSPILSPDNKLNVHWVDADERQLPRYKGKHHWHVYKEVGTEISRIHDNGEEDGKSSIYRYRTRLTQKLYNYFTLYGDSLTTSDVKDSKFQVVLPASASGGKEEKQHLNLPKKEKMKSDNAQRIQNELIEEEARKMENVEVLLKRISSDNYSAAIDRIDETLPSFKTSEIRLKLFKRKFRLQRSYLRSFKQKTALTIEDTSQLDFLRVAFFATLSAMIDLEKMLDHDVFNRKKKYMEELIDQSPLHLENWYRFQMEKVSSRLPRREQGQPDERISKFTKEEWNPDQWQVDFLNAVDKQESVIIVAPTASGKTYASYYAMHKVLIGDYGAKGVCVYVAPTKALVNQVAATIYSKFGPIFGMFTRDYRERVDECRILVTVPQCLEILLVSPSHQEWCKKIQYCIFDEIHCMSSVVGSDVWERTMLLINCPMIGLSATVNNGEDLCQWIRSIEQRRSVLFETPKPREVRFISHNERLADLNKYLYSNRQLHPLHPVGLMNAKQLSNSGLPKDFSLSPCETIQLNDAMQMSNIKGRQIPTLTEHFSPNWICERSECNIYSQFVRKQFDGLIAKRQDADIDSVATILRPLTSKDVHYPELKPLSSLIVEFVLTLKEKDLLPCIVFTDNRRLCERMAQCVADYFAKQESHLRETKYKSQIDEIKKRQAQIEKAPKKTEAKNPAGGSAESSRIDDEDRSHLVLSGSDRKLLNGVLEECTLVNRHGYDRKLVAKLGQQAARSNPRLASFMKRGVAYHHAELNNKGRVAVEALFRNRYVQIVFSTATLAMGIHMPTKTVAFLSDSIFLDALQYRQSSGRAGRRGFDIQGNIIFIDIPIPKIRHLIISAIPDIGAHFPTSVTFLMRLLHLCSNATDKKDAINRSLVALECPLISQSPTKHRLIDLQTRFHCLHTLDFLYRLNLVNGKGDLIGLAGLSTHLHYMEPANILLVYLMNNRLFHGLSEKIDIITTLARLFTNSPWLITRQQFETLTSTRRQRMLNSILFLPPMSSEFNDHVQTYNSIIKDVYGFYIENVSQQMRSIPSNNQEQSLPFSGISFTQTPDYDDGTFEYTLHHHYSQQSSNPSISPFAGLSGLTHEQFMSNYNLSAGSWDLAYDLDLSPRVVPFVEMSARDHTNSTYHLNSYAIDFFKHGSEALLISENQLSPNDTHKLLLDFHLVLSSIKTSLQVIVENEEKQTTANDLEFFRPLFRSIFDVQEIFSKKFYEEYPASFKN